MAKCESNNTKLTQSCNYNAQNSSEQLPFMARLAIAPAATLRMALSLKLLRSISKESRPPAETILAWFDSAY